jgi:hypothetical protein
MAKSSKVYDLFIAHEISDAALAAEIAQNCAAQGLAAFTKAELPADGNASEQIWEALAESRAFLAILFPGDPSPLMTFEIGAARAWNKPMFAVVTDPVSSRVPAGLTGVRLYPAGRIADVIESIKRSFERLSEKDRLVLANIYTEMDLTVDQLALEPLYLDKLVKQFSQGTGKAVSGERLLSELLRMRKQGSLAMPRSIHSEKRRNDTA